MATAGLVEISPDLPEDVNRWSVAHVAKFLTENKTVHKLADEHIQILEKEGFEGRDLLVVGTEILRLCEIPLGGIVVILHLINELKVIKGLAEPDDHHGTKRKHDEEEETVFQPLRKDSDLIEPYRDIFLMVERFGQYTMHDLVINDILALPEAPPPFVMSHLALLQRKRHLVDNEEHKTECQYVEAKLGDLFKEYFASEPAPSDPTKLRLASSRELLHLVNIVALDKDVIRHGIDRKFEDDDAYWLFFHSIASHYDLSQPEFKSKLREDDYFKIPVSNGTDFATYCPRICFNATLKCFPLLIVEVSSSSSDTQEQDRYRMLLQGAFIVRFANMFLSSFKKEKDFVLVAVYISEQWQVTRYLLFQKETSTTVFYVQHSFGIFGEGNHKELLWFTLEMYNLVHSYEASKFTDAPGLVSKLHIAVMCQHWPSVSQLVNDSNNPNKRRRVDSGMSDHTQSRGGREAELFEAKGYELVHRAPEVPEGFMLWDQPPPHIYTIRRARDTSGAEFIAKKTRDSSDEAEVLEFLRTVESPSEHIIPLIESIESSLGKFLVFPKRSSVMAQLCSGGGNLRGKLFQLSRDLARGLLYLHEHGIAHLDIKPDNLVYTNAFRLQIIDFDACVRVKDEDEKIDEYLGTPGWMAPEIGTEDSARCMYSPIRADKWSCGRVFFEFAETSSRESKELIDFAKRLMNKNPLHRPSLLEWSEPSR